MYTSNLIFYKYTVQSQRRGKLELSQKVPPIFKIFLPIGKETRALCRFYFFCKCVCHITLSFLVPACFEKIEIFACKKGKIIAILKNTGSHCVNRFLKYDYQKIVIVLYESSELS